MFIEARCLHLQRAIYSRNHHTISIADRRNECGVNYERQITIEIPFKCFHI